MRVSAGLGNNKTFRLIWWLAMLPLEVFRVLLLATSQIICIVSHRNATRIFAVFWFLGFIRVIQIDPETDSQIFTAQFLIEGGIVMLVLNALHPRFVQSLRKMQTQRPLWRITAPAAVKKPQYASMVIPSSSSPAENRRRMTSRLSPELQGMLVE